ncbi:MAG TPA: AGE family epimerase/isomerase [Verrucomicrobiota bacterium]|nr:AGE family epimerase/isomerase [Verrucomicrobiota bacterium]
MNHKPASAHSNDKAALAARIGEHLHGHILPFWCAHAVDYRRGGWMAWLTNDLRTDRTRPKGLIVHARILWAFSAAYLDRPDAIYQQMALRAFEFLAGRFWDHQHGGAFWRLDDYGRLLDDSKKTYGQAFCIYALTEFHRAFGDKEALKIALTVFGLLDRHARDVRHGGYAEVLRRDWSEAGPEARLSDKDMNEKKSMNNHLHVLEAYTNLFRVTSDAGVRSRLVELIQIFLDQILHPQTDHLHHFFDEEWNVRSDTYTFGHDIEASWLLCEAADVVEDALLTPRVRHTALRMADTALEEGLAADGGLCYEGKGGRVIDAGKECWPQAEAVVGFLNAHELSGEDKYLEAAQRVWAYIEKHIADRVHGEWFWRINEDGKPDATLPKVSEWKGPYHGTRACLEATRRLRRIASHSTKSSKTVANI